MNMVQIFEEQIIKTTVQKLEQALEKLKEDFQLQQKFRELADISSNLEKLDVILRESFSDTNSREEWMKKRNKLNQKFDKLYSEIVSEGFEIQWISILVDHEKQKLVKLLENARENARKKYFGEIDIKEIDILDNRWVLVGEQIKEVIANYIEGNI